MDELIKKLSGNLTANPDVTIRKTEVWQLPVVFYEVSYDRVKRLKMDILMKMLLFAFQQSEIRRAAPLADMLSVEELFVSDLIEKMQRTGLILLGKKGYVLTPKGYDYLGKGIFEEELDGEQALISFNTTQDEYRLTETDSLADDEEFRIYRYAIKKKASTDAMLEFLSKEKNTIEEDFQILVSGIVKNEELGTGYIPCIEFQLYNRTEDIFYARVWNTATGLWDEIVEKQIEEQELVEWRRAMEGEKEGIDK